MQDSFLCIAMMKDIQSMFYLSRTEDATDATTHSPFPVKAQRRNTLSRSNKIMDRASAYQDMKFQRIELHASSS